MRMREFMNLIESNDSWIVVRPRGWNAANDEPQTWTRPGHLYRGMSEAEYKTTVGAGKGLRSDQRHSAPGEGTCFDSDAASAESYANYGRSDPRITKLPNYLVEIDPQGTDIRRDRDGYWKSPYIAQEAVRRVWQMEARDDQVIARLIKQS